MKIICAYSGLQYSVPEHFPGIRLANTEAHPIFSVPSETLANCYAAWVRRELKHEDTYLLALALLHSTNLIEFRTAASFSDSGAQTGILNTHLQSLFNITQLLVNVPHPQFIAPKIVIAEDTANLESLAQWVRIWREAYEDFRAGQAESMAFDALKKKEQALAKFINSSEIPEHKYAHVLADWAALAASFPPEYTTYWKECIIKCYQAQSALVIPPVHLQDIREWCEEHIDEYSCGSIFSYRLYSLISAVQDCREDFELLPTSGGQAHLQAVIDSAPISEPLRSHYASQLDYMRAKAAWILAQSQTRTL